MQIEGKIWPRLKEIIRGLTPPLLSAVGRKGIAWMNRQNAADYRIRYGPFSLVCDSSHHLPRILQTFPDFGRNLADLVLALELKQTVVIDVGANIGDSALLLARFAPGCKILCIEGDSQYLPYLESNISQIDDVAIKQGVLSDQNRSVHGKIRRVAGTGTGRVVLSDEGDTVSMRTLDDVLEEMREFSRPDVLKIDTDGHEMPILRGAAETLRACTPALHYEWHPGCWDLASENDTHHAEMLTEFGYQHFFFFANSGELVLRANKPSSEIVKSLANFSRQRRTRDDLHYDVVALPLSKSGAAERLWAKYSNTA